MIVAAVIVHLFFCLVVLPTETAAFLSARTIPITGHSSSGIGMRTSISLLQSSSNKDSSPSFDMAELSRRIAGIQTAEKLLGNPDDFARTNSNNSNNNKDGNAVSVVALPAIAFDALLPNQRTRGRTTDRTFGRMLASLGLGGLFVVVSVNHAQRKLRRNGVIVRVELVDAPANGNANNGRSMTAVDFQLVGLRRCRLVGPPTDLKARVGRWRRAYDPDGEESKLGFGVERFVNVEENVASCRLPNDLDMDKVKAAAKGLPVRKWSSVPVDYAILDDDVNDINVIEKAESLIPLLEKWQQLASNPKTYDNIDVVAGSRVMKGRPGLRVDPAALLRRVLKDLGERPSPSDDACAFALWGAALINPLPSLGVAPEIRGSVLEAPDCMSKLKMLEWGIQRSIANLEGKTPL